MSNDKNPGKPGTGTAPTSAGLKRRDLLLSGEVRPGQRLQRYRRLDWLGSRASATTGTGYRQGKGLNIVAIMGDDIGIWNIGAYHRGMMAGRTPNLDKFAAEGMLFTDYYAEASCTAGRANFITGELPIRTGTLTTSPWPKPAHPPAFRRRR